jgi:hypothetical protein
VNAIFYDALELIALVLYKEGGRLFRDFFVVHLLIN